MDTDVAVLQRAAGLRDDIIAPNQSEFRVLAILRYVDSHGQHHEVVGTNSEQCFIGGSLCAERAALSKLRHHDCARIERIFLVSDLDGPLTPGVLCREMLLSACDADTVVVMAGRGGRADADEDAGDGDVDGDTSGDCASHETELTSCSDAQAPCTAAAVGADSTTVTPAMVMRRTLRQLYPYRCAYSRLSKDQIIASGQAFQDAASGTGAGAELREPRWRELYLEALAAASHDCAPVHPVRYGAAVLFSDGSSEVGWQLKAMEYGATLDAVSMLAHPLEKRRVAAAAAATGDDDQAAAAARAAAQPVIIMQVDHFGRLHAPFAPARSFLYEHHYDDALVAVHVFAADNDGCGTPLCDVAQEPRIAVEYVKVAQLVPDSPQHIFDGAVVEAKTCNGCC